VRRPIVIACLIALLALGAAISAEPAPAGYWTSCGTPPVATSGDTLAHQVKCRSALRLVNAFLKLAQAEGPHVTTRGFSCVGKVTSQDPLNFLIRCSKGPHRVRFHGSVG
jgi:hypothetical protein